MVGYSDLSIVNLTKEKYDELVGSGGCNPRAIYIVSSNYIDAYGQRVENVADAESVSDAVNLGQAHGLVDVKLNQIAAAPEFDIYDNYDEGDFIMHDGEFY